MTPTKEQELLDALRCAEQSGDAPVIENAVSGLALYYVATEQFVSAVPFWRRGADLLARSTAPDSAEVATYLHNMAARCLIPAGLLDEARATLRRSKDLYAVHFRADAGCVRDIDELLNKIET
jgi:hypothetical protein